MVTSDRRKQIAANWLCRILIGTGFAVSAFTLFTFFYYEGTNDSLRADLSQVLDLSAPMTVMYIAITLIAFWLGSVFFARIAADESLSVKERLLACGPMFLMMVVVVGTAWLTTRDSVLTHVCDRYGLTRQQAASACTIGGILLGNVLFMVISIVQGVRRFHIEAARFSPLVPKKIRVHRRSFFTAAIGAAVLITCTVSLQQNVSHSAAWLAVALSGCGMFAGMYLLVCGVYDNSGSDPS